METLWPEVGGWIAAAVIAIIGGMFALWPKKGTLEHQLIDQLQEEVASLRKRMDDYETRETTREKYVRSLERRDREWAQYHAMIAMGIERGTIPPMLPLPPILLEEL